MKVTISGAKGIGKAFRCFPQVPSAGNQEYHRYVYVYIYIQYMIYIHIYENLRM